MCDYKDLMEKLNKVISESTNSETVGEAILVKNQLIDNEVVVFQLADRLQKKVFKLYDKVFI